MSLSKFTKAAVEKNVAERGKRAESEVRKVLLEMSEKHLRFASHRVLDARSAGGKLPAQAGDFFWSYTDGKTTPHGLLEVKEVEHAAKLPYKNLSPESYARMHKRELAGAKVFVLVAHRVPAVTVVKSRAVGLSVASSLQATDSTTTVWRFLPLANFGGPRPGGSWDLSYAPPVDLKNALLTLMKL